MLLARLQLDESISWGLDRSDPSLFPIPGSADWLLLNPLLYEFISSRIKVDFFEFNPGRYIGSGLELCFVKIGSKYDQCNTKSEFPHVKRLALDLLTRLRDLTGQACIPRARNLLGVLFQELDEIPADSRPDTFVAGFQVQEYLLNVAITSRSIADAMFLGDIYAPPTYEVLLLDAIAALREEDFRAAILYAALSMEIAFGRVIEDEYQAVLARQGDERFRVVSIPIAGGATRTKDPVYERLRGRDEFSVRLHELSLYVLRRSLLIEDEALYQNAKRLYATRNQLAHTGAVEDSLTDKVLRIDNSGASDAVITVTKVFNWLGLRAEFPLPN